MRSQHEAGSQNPEITTRSQTKTRILNRLHHPGTPPLFFLTNITINLSCVSFTPKRQGFDRLISSSAFLYILIFVFTFLIFLFVIFFGSLCCLFPPHFMSWECNSLLFFLLCLLIEMLVL